jgi:hypothetical protein
MQVPIFALAASSVGLASVPAVMIALFQDAASKLDSQISRQITLQEQREGMPCESCSIEREECPCLLLFSIER